MIDTVDHLYNGTFPIKLPKQRAEALAKHGEAGWEKARIETLHQKIGKGDVVYYVGSEQGDIPALVALWGAKVVLVEASHLMWGNVKTIFDINKVTPLEIFRGFAANKTTVKLDRQLRLDAFDLITASWLKDPGFYELHTSSDDPRIKLDDLVNSGTPPPNLITMDVEGSEMEVLKGSEKTILDHKPIIVLSLHPEFLFNYWGVYSRECRNWILDKGYKETLLDYQHEVHLLYEPR